MRNFTSSFQIVKEAIYILFMRSEKTQLQYVLIEQIIKSNPQILLAQSNTYKIVFFFSFETTNFESKKVIL